MNVWCIYVIVHNLYDTSSLLSMNLTQSKIMIILGRRRLQIFLSVFGFVFIYYFLSTFLVLFSFILFCPRFWLLHKQSQCWSRQRLICCKIATKKQRLLRILIAIYCPCKSSRGRTCFVARVFQQHVAHCWVLTHPAPTLNQMAEKTFHCSDEKLSRGKKREIPC